MTRKPGIVQNESVRGPYPEKLPDFPQDVKERFPSMAQTQDQLNQWWFQTRSVLERMQAELQALIEDAKNSGTASADEIAALTTQFATMTATITGIQQTITSLSQALAALGDPSVGIAALNAALAAHEADTTTHGTTGNIVGDTDEQALSSKVIGLNEPRYGRFSILMSGGVINFGEDFTVPLGYTMLVGDSLTVNGMLTINGSLKIL